jgi:hypothetical protein
MNTFDLIAIALVVLAIGGWFAKLVYCAFVPNDDDDDGARRAPQPSTRATTARPRPRRRGWSPNAWGTGTQSLVFAAVCVAFSIVVDGLIIDGVFGAPPTNPFVDALLALWDDLFMVPGVSLISGAIAVLGTWLARRVGRHRHRHWSLVIVSAGVVGVVGSLVLPLALAALILLFVIDDGSFKLF